MKFGQFIPYSKRKKINQKILQKLQPKKLVPGPFEFAIIMHNLYWKMKFLKQATYISYVITKLSKLV